MVGTGYEQIPGIQAPYIMVPKNGPR